MIKCGLIPTSGRSLDAEVFRSITIDGKDFVSVEPNPSYVPIFAAVVTGQKLGYRALKPTPSPNTQVLLASGIIVIGVNDWVIKLANVA